MHEWTPQDERAVAAQLRRAPRGAIGVAARCPCGLPAVVATMPRLADGTPFPTLYYSTCPRVNAALSTLEADGFMRQQAQRLVDEPGTAEAYREAHRRYLADRSAHETVPEIEQVSAGGMPDRVKCLHALAAQSMACGAGVNPVGDAALARIGAWWTPGPCVEVAG